MDPAKAPIHIFHHSFTRGGGKERYGLLLASTFKAMGHPVVFHAAFVDEALAQASGLEVRAVPIAQVPRKLIDYRFFRKLDSIRPQLDGIQITLSRVRARDLLISGGNHRGYLSRARKLTGPFDLLQIWMEIQCYRFARKIIAHSDLLAADLSRFYKVPSVKILTLYPPIESTFKPATSAQQIEELRREFDLPSDRIVFLFPSKGHSRKGLKPITRALEQFGDQAILAVAGKPPSGARLPFVRYLGYVDDIIAAYRAADFTILGSYFEPFGLVGPESLLCGTRLVFEQDIGCLSAINPEFVFTFSVWDIESIRRAIASAISLARQGGHRIADATKTLKYDPSALIHAEALFRAAIS
jgi:glycosyltransferase involved in cell wall biosynthesis